MSSFEEILKEVKSLKKNISFYSISNNENIELSPLTLYQQKSIIENSYTSAISLLYFNNTIFKILKENVKTNLNNLDTVDRVNILLSLRQNISDSYIDQSNNINISLSEIINRNKNIEVNFEPKIVQSENFKFYLNKPSLTTDNKVNNSIIKNYENNNLDNSNISSFVSDLYVYELVKFIEKIEFNEQEFVLNSNISNSVKLLNEIDSKHFEEPLQYINELRDLELQFTAIPNSNSNIPLTPDFFITNIQ